MRAGFVTFLLVVVLCLAPAAGTAQNAETIVVTARRLDARRSRIQASLGATVHSLDAVSLAQVPQGANAPLNLVLLQVPGVAQDSFGQIHVRGDHNDVQYRLDGIQLPEGLAVFGQALQTRFARSLDLITGALPAQYGVLQAAVVNIVTRSGTNDPGGEISVYGGARDYLQTSLSYGKRAGAWDVFVTADVVHDRLGIENPDSGFDAIHDLSNQYHALAHISYVANDSTRISLITGVSNAQFQIPDNPGQLPTLDFTDAGVTSVPSSTLSEHQREITDFAILSDQQRFGDIDVQTALFSRYSSLYFTPDPVGDLLFAGIAQTAARSVWSSGVQSDASWSVSAAHTLRAGLQITGERGGSSTQSSVFALNPQRVELGSAPVSVTEGSGRTGGLYGVYVQDEWTVAPSLTMNAGLRFDVVDEYTHDNQLSPRANLVWRATSTTTLHGGYSRYFTPPPFEAVAASSIAGFASTSGAAPSNADAAVRAERDNYLDLGIDQRVISGLHLSLDTYYKSARNLIDEGQFGAPIILTAFNYARGQVDGVETSVAYDHGPWSLYANTALSRAIARQIDSAQFNFSAAELSYIDQHWIHLDHDQRWSSSAGMSYRAFAAGDDPLRLSSDLIVGSGLRAAGRVSNGRALDGYYTINLAAEQTLKVPGVRGMSARVDIINLLDRAYELRDGTGVGVGAPQYGRRRTILAGLTEKF